MKMSGGMTQYRIMEDCPLSRFIAQIPLSLHVFISGSAATWMAERSLFHNTIPDWNPHDIDIFACLPSADFNNMVDRYMCTGTPPIAKPRFKGAAVAMMLSM
jgi:hypothetical protein